MKRISLFVLLAAVALLASAAAPNGSGTYYQNANGKKGSALKTALCGILWETRYNPALSYNELWTAFHTTDVRSDGKIWDMYSDKTNYEPGGSAQGHNYSGEGDSYNREHSFPASWFGSNTPMYTDLHHIYPTDGYINNRRSNYPFGETNGNTYKSHNSFSKLGSCTVSGYTGTVFEPADEYKGDFARTYFYMVTCYEEKLADWYSKNSESRATIDGSAYPGFQTWQLNMLLKWAKDDPVSAKEIARNTAVKNLQGNRNPFIDYPGLEQYIWGSCKDTEFSYNNYVQPTTWSTEYNSSSGSGSGGSGGGQGGSGTGEGDYFVKITSSNDFENGGTYLIVYEEGNKALTGSATSANDIKAPTDVTISNNKIEATDAMKAISVTIATDATAGYTVKTKSGYYIYNTSSTSNGLSANVNLATAQAYTATISFDESGNVTLTAAGSYLRYNTNSSIFSYYKASTYTGQQAIQLYKFVEDTTPPVKNNPEFNNLSDVSVNCGSTLTLTKGTTGTPNIVTDGTVTLTSSNEAVVTVSGLTITSHAVGTAIITINAAASDNYNAGSTMAEITVNAPDGKTTAAPTATAVFTETFDESTGNSGWSGNAASGTLNYDNTGWSVKYGNGNGGSAKFGNSSGQGSAITPALGTAGDLTLTFKSGAWDGDKTTGGLVLSVEAGGGTLSTTTFDLSNARWTTYSTTITGATAETRIKFSAAQSSKNRFFLDDVVVTKPGVTLTKTLNDYGYASYCSEYPLDFSDYESAGYSAWQVTGVSGETINFAQVTGTVKGGTGLILKGEPGETVTLHSANSETTLSGNLLEGTLAPKYVAADQYYGLSGNEFVKVNAGTVPAGKALLPASALGSNVKAFTFVFEEDATGISLMEDGRSQMEDGVIYKQGSTIVNLAGQRLDNSQLKRGIYIVNGKKILK